MSNCHLSDQALVMVADGELPFYQDARARAHLLSCWSCRGRMKEIEQVIAEFVRLHSATADSHLNSGSCSRAVLQVRLAQLITDSKSQPWLPSACCKRVQSLVACMIMCALLTLVWHRRFPQGNRQIDVSLKSAAPLHSPIPNRRLTPGAIRLATKNEVCRIHDANIEHPVPLSVQREVFREYGMANAEPEDYEVDHLITPGLGGSDDLRNLWPEPHSATIWNSYVKDALEDRLHQMVCDGKLDLASAQREIATDWIAAYKKYFFTDKPSVERRPSTLGRAGKSDSRS